MVNKLEQEFLKQSNAIEQVYDQDSLIQARYAWEFIKRIKLISVADVLELHRILMLNLNPRIAGKFRDCAVYIGGQRCPAESDTVLSNKVIEVLDVINAARPKKVPDLKKKRGKVAQKTHVKFERIHPFEDGNGRTGRILWQIHRIRLGLPVKVIREGDDQVRYYGWFR